MTPREKLVDYLAQEKAPPRARVAAALGISGTTLSQYLNEKYPGNLEQIDKAVADYFDKLSERLASAKTGPAKGFAQTRQVRIAWGVLRHSHIEGDMGLIVGAAGVGKTETLKKYCADNKGTILVTALITVNIRVLLISISESLRIYSGGVNDYLARSIINVLKGSGRLMVVDEAQHLTPKCLEILRQIHDETGVGLVYAGSKDLYRKMAHLEQISSRIGMTKELPHLEMEDVKLILESTRMPLAEGSIAKAAELSGGSARCLLKGFKHACRMANGKDVTPAMIAAAQKYILAG